jgi:hypothetical protein
VLIDHIRSALGEVDRSLTETSDGEELPFHLLLFEDQPERGAVTFVTLGLSAEPLRMEDGNAIRQELVLSCHDRWATAETVDLLLKVGWNMLTERKALIRGWRIGVSTPMPTGRTTVDLFCTAPGFFSDDFAIWDGSDPVTVFVQLVPITSAESQTIATHGWEWFEDLLAAEQPDILDLGRASAPTIRAHEESGEDRRREHANDSTPETADR